MLQIMEMCSASRKDWRAENQESKVRSQECTCTVKKKNKTLTQVQVNPFADGETSEAKSGVKPFCSPASRDNLHFALKHLEVT